MNTSNSVTDSEACSRYTEEQLRSPVSGPAHRPPRDLSDNWAWGLIKFARWCTDRATGYKLLRESTDSKGPMTNLDERGWLVRFVLYMSPDPVHYIIVCQS